LEDAPDNLFFSRGGSPLAALAAMDERQWITKASTFAAVASTKKGRSVT
jgi:hypothetical protein